eukprot:TRINITY_DN55276_c0_g1_i1.p1 TRINITY_DN55276_c0_g1~~TRINITY_DN55276_c0_g1_i1.p1  ORF type:complete len:177 (-),score=25.19 TRINITY_DN55276_c0_g1_i1:433-963(-)
MAQLGWVTGVDNTPVKFKRNVSGRFESRFSTVRICTGTKAIMLKGMEGSCLGVWVAHGEGRAEFESCRDSNQESEAESCLANGLVPLQYANDEGESSHAYPFCPNGSPLGIAGLCSTDGRHLAMMPHPERAVLPWQWSWMPSAMEEQCRTAGGISPWIKMFQNAAEWTQSPTTNSP